MEPVSNCIERCLPFVAVCARLAIKVVLESIAFMTDDMASVYSQQQWFPN